MAGIEDLTLDEIFAELDARAEARNRPPADAFWVQDIMDAQNIGKSAAQTKIKNWEDAGDIELVQTWRGRNYYRVVTDDSTRD